MGLFCTVILLKLVTVEILAVLCEITHITMARRVPAAPPKRVYANLQEQLNISGDDDKRAAELARLKKHFRNDKMILRDGRTVARRTSHFKSYVGEAAYLLDTFTYPRENDEAYVWRTAFTEAISSFDEAKDHYIAQDARLHDNEITHEQYDMLTANILADMFIALLKAGQAWEQAWRLSQDPEEFGAAAAAAAASVPLASRPRTAADPVVSSSSRESSAASSASSASSSYSSSAASSASEPVVGIARSERGNPIIPFGRAEYNATKLAVRNIMFGNDESEPALTPGVIEPVAVYEQVRGFFLQLETYRQQEIFAPMMKAISDPTPKDGPFGVQAARMVRGPLQPTATLTKAQSRHRRGIIYWSYVAKLAAFAVSVVAEIVKMDIALYPYKDALLVYTMKKILYETETPRRVYSEFFKQAMWLLTASKRVSDETGHHYEGPDKYLLQVLNYLREYDGDLEDTEWEKHKGRVFEFRPSDAVVDSPVSVSMSSARLQAPISSGVCAGNRIVGVFAVAEPIKN